MCFGLPEYKHNSKHHLLLLIISFRESPKPPVETVQVSLVNNAPTVEADKLPLLDVSGDKQTLSLVSTGVHVMHACAMNLVIIVKS